MACFLNEERSLDFLIKSNKSLIRWGDGESTIITGGDLYFQKNTFYVFWSILKLVRSYSSKSPYLIAVPVEFISKSKMDLISSGKFKIWIKTRYVFWFYFIKKNNLYLDSFVFREDSLLLNSEINKLWIGYDEIAFVHSNYKYYIDFCEKNPEKVVHYIPVFSANAATNVSDVIKSLSEIEKKCATVNKSLCALVCAGPAGKVIVYKLSGKKIKALDMGHYFDYKFYGLKRDK